MSPFHNVLQHTLMGLRAAMRPGMSCSFAAAAAARQDQYINSKSINREYIYSKYVYSKYIYSESIYSKYIYSKYIYSSLAEPNLNV